MTREEHLQWCKDRAIEEMDFTHDPKQGIISMLSDIRKHPETDSPALAQLAIGLMQLGKLSTRQQVIEFIEGFN